MVKCLSEFSFYFHLGTHGWNYDSPKKYTLRTKPHLPPIFFSTSHRRSDSDAWRDRIGKPLIRTPIQDRRGSDKDLWRVPCRAITCGPSILQEQSAYEQVHGEEFYWRHYFVFDHTYAHVALETCRKFNSCFFMEPREACIHGRCIEAKEDVANPQSLLRAIVFVQKSWRRRSRLDLKSASFPTFPLEAPLSRSSRQVSRRLGTYLSSSNSRGMPVGSEQASKVVLGRCRVRKHKDAWKCWVERLIVSSMKLKEYFALTWC